MRPGSNCRRWRVSTVWRRSSGWTADLNGAHLAKKLRQEPELRLARRLPSPDEPYLAACPFAEERPGDQRGCLQDPAVESYFRQQGDAEAVLHHLHQRVQAGCGEGPGPAAGEQTASIEGMLAEEMAARQEQQCIGIDVAGIHSIYRRQRMVRRAGQPEGVIEQRFRDRRTIVAGQGKQQEVELPVMKLGDQPRGLVFAQVELQPGPLLAHQRQDARQKEGRDRGDYAHADGAGQGLARDPGSLHQLLRLAQDAASAGEDLLARIGEKYVSAAPVDEDHAEILLEFLDPGAERRL